MVAKQNKPLPHELLVLYRKRSGLTQNQLAALIGLKSDRMILKWESGYTLPAAARLQNLIQVYLRAGVFINGREQEEARELWLTVKDMFDQNSSNFESYPIFDERWFEQLILPSPLPTVSTGDTTHLSFDKTQNGPGNSPGVPDTTSILQNHPTGEAKLEQPLMAPGQTTVTIPAPLLASNLPIALTSFVGRQAEMAEIKRLINWDAPESLSEFRLLTLVGVGGIGKTRLSFYLAAEMLPHFKHGVCLVELASLFEVDLIPRVVASQLGVKEDPHKPIGESLIDYLYPRQILLMLDNCEHLVMAVARLAETLLEACPQLKILTTSREGLGIKGELQYQLSPLSLQPISLSSSGVNLAPASEAVRLFVERARAVEPSFTLNDSNRTTLEQICNILEGLPLAIELAAVRLKVLTADEIALRLENRLKLLTLGSRTALPRLQTLKASIEWSYDLLTPLEKVVFRDMAVFAGGFTLQAVESVCAEQAAAGADILDLLTQLVNKSLVIAARPDDNSSEMRYRMLETIREYALDCLHGAGESEKAYLRFLDYFMATAERNGRILLYSSQDDQTINQLEIELDNFRAALRWALEHSQLEKALRLSTALEHFWFIKGYWREGQDWLETCLAQSEREEVRPQWRAKALRVSGQMASLRLDAGLAQTRFEESLLISRKLEDKPALARVLGDFGKFYHHTQEAYERARELLDESLSIYRELNDNWGICVALYFLGHVEGGSGNFNKATELAQESLKIARQQGNKLQVAEVLANLSYLAYMENDLQVANEYDQEALELFQEIGNKWGISDIMITRSRAALYTGEYEKARPLLERALAIGYELDFKPLISQSICYLGRAALFQGNYRQARPLFEQSLRVLGKVPNMWRGRWAESLEGLGGCNVLSGDYRQAVRVFGAAEVMREEDFFPIPLPERPIYERFISLCRDQVDERNFSRLWAEGRTLKLLQQL
jgi:predicted ATPase/transcriptional regulator with XRE-family HTH domain